MFGLGLGRLGASGSAFSPASVAGKRLWLRPSVTAGMWQDSAGTTSMSAVGTLLDTSNPVGLMLDYSQSAALGPELVTNGDFSNGATGWTVGTGWSISGGVATSVGSNQFQSVSQGIAGVAANKTYLISVSVTCTSGSLLVRSGSGVNLYDISSSGTLSIRVMDTVGGSIAFMANATGFEFVGSIYNISVREILGNHLKQPTSTARPVLSARRNLLTHTEDPSISWGGSLTISTGVSDPFGGYSAVTLSASSPNSDIFSTIFSSIGNGVISTLSFYAKRRSGAYSFLAYNQVYQYTTTSVSITDTWEKYTLTNTSLAAGDKTVGFILQNTGDTIDICNSQLEIGSTATPYQRVNTDSDYTAAPPTYLKLDGVDDALASATLTAGTLGSNVDVFIVVRRDTAGNVTLGYPTPGATTFFGMAESGSGSVCHASVGTPTVWVDGVQLSGGTSVTRGTLHTALTVGDWHVVEFRNIDLSAWTQIGEGGHTGYLLNGALGESLIADAMPDATRAKVRTYLGKTVGKVL